MIETQERRENEKMQETIKTKNGYREQVIENNQVTIMGEIVSEFSIFECNPVRKPCSDIDKDMDNHFPKV